MRCEVGGCTNEAVDACREGYRCGYHSQTSGPDRDDLREAWTEVYYE